MAELVGTALLVLFGAGSVVAALTLGGGELDYAGLGFIALAFAIVIAVVIYAFGPVSGAHINPAVTFSLAVTRRFPWVETVPYVLAQLVGGAVGGLVAQPQREAPPAENATETPGASTTSTPRHFASSEDL